MYTNKAWLEQTYVKDGKTLQEIADICGCGYNTVLKYMNKHGISRRRRGPSQRAYPYITKGWLHQKFVVEKMSIVKIASACDRYTSSIDALLNYFGIEQEQDLYHNREWLHQRYILDDMTKEQVAEEFGCHIHTIERWLKRHNLIGIKINRKRHHVIDQLFRSYIGKTCPCCFRFLLWDCYIPHKDYPDGYSYRCRSCKENGPPPANTVTKQYYVDQLGGSCNICKYNKCVAALVFHHVDQETKQAAPDRLMLTLPSQACDEELDKCILLCANCHLELHSGKVDITPVKRKGLGWTTL